MGHTPGREMTKERRGGQSGWRGVVLKAVKAEDLPFWKENRKQKKKLNSKTNHQLKKIKKSKPTN